MTDEVEAPDTTDYKALYEQSQESVGKLTANNKLLVGEKQQANTNAKEAEAKRATAAENAAQESGNVEAINSTWQTKYDTDLGAKNDEIKSLASQLKAETIGRKAQEMADLIGVGESGGFSKRSLAKEIESRLGNFDTEDGKIIAVIDAKGNRIAQTHQELMNDISSDPHFADAVIGSKASGSGGAGSKLGGGAADFSKMTMTERADLANNNPERFAQLNRK